MKFLPLIWSNLKRKKLRTLLTVLSVLVAFILFGYLSAIEQGLGAGVQIAGADRLVIRHKISIIQLLPESYKARMERISGVAAAVHQTWFGGYFQEPRNFFAQMPVVPTEFMKMFPEYVLPTEQLEAWNRTRTGAIVGEVTARRFGWKIGDRIPIQSSIWSRTDGSRTWEFDLVGIYQGGKPGTDVTQFFFRHDYFEEARMAGKGQVGWYTVRVANPEEAEQVARKIDEEFANSPAETKAETEGAFLRSFAEQVGNIGLIMKAILSAVFFTILLVAGNTMAQAVRERIEEVGVLKALGFTDVQVLSMVLAESCLLSGLGGLAGLALSWLLIGAGDQTGGLLPNMHIPSSRMIGGASLALALGVVTGLIPALQAMRLRVAEALRRG